MKLIHCIEILSCLCIGDLVLCFLGPDTTGAVEKKISILAEDICHTNDGDLIVIHQYPL